MANAEVSAVIAESFGAYSHIGKVVDWRPNGNGHINDTFLLTAENGKRYTYQRINTDIFHDYEGMMQNILAVTSHIRAKAAAAGEDPARAALNVVRADDGKPYHKDSHGLVWRMYDYMENTVAKERVETPQEFADCAFAFGRFQDLLSDFDASRLVKSIPEFHITPVYYAAFERAAKKDAFGRAAKARAEIDFVRERAAFAGTLENAQKEGKLPLRVTHNDTKLNNILFDTETHKPVCVIDLDTVMPGYSVNDFGDSIRFGANTAAEDETDLSKVALDLGLYRTFADSYVKGCNGKLTDAEIDLLPIGARMMTFECGMRFLTDYLEGDHYFHVAREGHNLDRARCQFALLADMERREREMKLR